MEGFSQQVLGVLKEPTSAHSNVFGLDHGSPIRLWIVQVGIIICTASLLSLGLRKLHQPKVIAEVLGGILLGPTAFGRIPGFTERFFPDDSRPYLGLVANIGLCLFLFLVGLEIDLGVIKRNARLSATVALAGMILPFAIGASLSVAIYREFIDPSVKFTHFMLFTGIAYSITAFPVLCRILTELKLLDTTVGIVVLSAGVGNDIVGWTLLALSVALVNAGTGFAAVHILLVCVGWTIVVLFPLRWFLSWLARSTGSIESGPTVFFMTVTMLVLFGSAFLTDVIGVHAIFGAFLAGIIVPREGGLAIALTEKLEDMVTIIFLPLYFTLSGLSTDLGLLDNAKIWAYTTAIIASAFVGKFGGCSLAAHYVAGFDWRESTAIGSLMSCKGLVELIVLNVGLSAGILSRRVFSMFVLEALVLTFMTTPLVTWLYPPHLRTRISASGSKPFGVGDGESVNVRSRTGSRKTRFTVVLDKFEHLAGMMALTQLVTPSQTSSPKNDTARPLSLAIPESEPSPTSVEALRVIELSDRVSAVMKSSAADALFRSDPLLSAFRMFGTLNQIQIDPSLAIVSFSEMARTIAEQASNYGSDMILIPWLTSGQDAFGGNPHHIQTGNPDSNPLSAPSTPKGPIQNPFELLFKGSIHHGSASIIHSQFVRSVFAQSTTDVALFVGQSMLDSLSDGKHHLFLPFFGGPDDRLALELVLQLCENPNVTATVVRIYVQEGPSRSLPSAGLKSPDDATALTVASHLGGSAYPDTHYGDTDAARRLQSVTADDFVWAKHARVLDTNSPDPGTFRIYGRINWKEASTLAPLHIALEEAQRAEYTTAHNHATSPISEGSPIAPHSPTASSDSVFRRQGPSFLVQRHSESRGGSTMASPAEERAPLLPTAGNGGIGAGEQGPSGPLIIVTGRSRRLAAIDHRLELKEMMAERGSLGAEVSKTVGDVASAFVLSGVGSGVLVLQSAGFNND
ncbi:potassium:hydrogen antiporter [Coprinopsis sp. MPI-PUGE-AT-0042]|nr:potassium:hydrogen antiporter [Coprinopsis sp. MPI-PUGE-AT-0042]